MHNFLEVHKKATYGAEFLCCPHYQITNTQKLLNNILALVADDTISLLLTCGRCG